MIETIEDIPIDIKKFKCKCDKSGVMYERIKKKDIDDVKLSNTEIALCDAEIVKFKEFLIENGYGGDCWCKHLGEFINAGI